MGFSLRSAAVVAALSISTVLALPQHGYGSGDLPVVDLGYERHQAAFYNETGQFYNFSNIRYAAPRTSACMTMVRHEYSTNTAL